MKKRIISMALAAVMIWTAVAPTGNVYADNTFDTVAEETTQDVESSVLEEMESVLNDAPAEQTEVATPTVAPVAPTLELAATKTGDPSGSCGPNLTWTLLGNTLVISGTGKMYDDMHFPASLNPNQVTSIVFNEGITYIGNYCFDEMHNVTSITFPQSLEMIGFGAFLYNSSLESLYLPTGYIGEAAFMGCVNLKYITVGSGVTGFGMNVFELDHAVERVTIEDFNQWCHCYFSGPMSNPMEMIYLTNDNKAEQTVLIEGQRVTSIVFPEGITVVPDYIFYRCTQITSVTIPSTVQVIGECAFNMCNSISTLNLAEGIKEIKSGAFLGCLPMAKLSIPSSVEILGPRAFAHCPSVRELWMGPNINSIGDYAFYNMLSLETIHYGGSQAQWDALSLGNANDTLKKPNVICSGSGDPVIKPIPLGMSVGATVEFGSYEQDDDLANGEEPLQWLVLDIQGDKALVVTKNIVNYLRYYITVLEKGPWENSDMRTWMNSTFLNDAFTPEQQASIYSTTVINEDNPVYGTEGGNDTVDKIFALSTSEAERYFENDISRVAVVTPYAKHCGITLTGSDPGLVDAELHSGLYFLRTQGIFSYNAAFVHFSGMIRYDGGAGANTMFGARPAMWVDKNVLKVQEDPVASFVQRLYQVCLNREPDMGGLSDWVNKLKNGIQTGSKVAYGFIFSDEFQSRNFCNKCYVEQLYRSFLGREADPAGLSAWTNLLENGTTREEVFNGFALSTEFSSLCTSYGIDIGSGVSIPQYGTVPKGACSVCGKQDGVTEFVKRLYDVCLNRHPDEIGLREWTNVLWNHTSTGKDTAYGFIFSAEFINKNLNDSEYIEYLYKAFFNRGPDPVGKANWLNCMHNQGYSREDVFNGFVGSDEFNKLCQKYGIIRG